MATSAVAGTVHLKLPPGGPYKVWASPDAPLAAPASAVTVDGIAADLEVPEKHYVAVLDMKSGNLAIDAPSAVKPQLELTLASFKFVGEAKVSVQHNGAPVSTASVEASDGTSHQTAVIDPSRSGTVSFYGLKQGTVQVTVRYVVSGKDADPVVQSIKIAAERADPIPTFQVALPGDVATVAAAAPTKAVDSSDTNNSGSPASSKDGSGKKEPLTAGTALRLVVWKIVTMLFGLGIVGGVLYFFFYIVKKDPKAVSDKLTALGVQIPKDPGAAADPIPYAPIPVAPEPPQKIILDDAAPTPLSMAPAAPLFPVAAADFGPMSRFTRDNGEETMIQEGSTLVGREAGLGMSLLDESTLSRRHAEITRNGNQVTIKDLGSTNGTFVNGRKISTDTPLKPGDEVQFGAVKFRVEA